MGVVQAEILDLISPGRKHLARIRNQKFYNCNHDSMEREWQNPKWTAHQNKMPNDAASKFQ